MNIRKYKGSAASCFRMNISRMINILIVSIYICLEINGAHVISAATTTNAPSNTASGPTMESLATGLSSKTIASTSNRTSNISNDCYPYEKYNSYNLKCLTDGSTIQKKFCNVITQSGGGTATINIVLKPKTTPRSPTTSKAFSPAPTGMKSPAVTSADDSTPSTLDSAVSSPSPVTPMFSGTVSTSAPAATGPVFIFIRLVFQSDTIPGESEVLSQGSPLLNGDEIRLDNVMRVNNLTYEKMADDSFSLSLVYQMSDIKFPANADDRTETEERIQDVVNDLMNGLLNQADANPFTFPQADFTYLPNDIRASVEYVYQEGDIEQPSKFLTAVLTAIDLASSATSTTISPVTTDTTAASVVVGRVLIFLRFVFNTPGPVPDESDIISLTDRVLGRRLRRSLTEPVRVQDAIFEKLSETSFALTLIYEISNVSISEQIGFRNETVEAIEVSVNRLLNQILGSPGESNFEFSTANITHFSEEIHANAEYVFEEGSIENPSSFLTSILTAIGLATTIAPPTVTPPPMVMGRVLIFLRFVFNTMQPVPAESDITSLADTLLVNRLRTLDQPAVVKEVRYEKISETSFAISVVFEIPEVEIAEEIELREETIEAINLSVNDLVSEVLVEPGEANFDISTVNITHFTDEIHANAEYVFQSGEIQQPSSFLTAVLVVSGLATTSAPVTTSPPVMLLMTRGSGNVAWILGFIIPVGVVIILIPCWILLCCALTGWCAALRGRFRRRRGYNLQQYQAHILSEGSSLE